MVSHTGARAWTWTLLAGVTLLTSCSPDSSGIRRLPLEPDAVAAVITLSPSATSLGFIGQTVQLTAQLVAGDGSPATGVSFHWTTTNPAVAAVTARGMVQAVSEGTAEILVRTVNIVGTAQITVKRVPATVTLSEEEFLFTELQQSQTVSATILDGGGQGLPSSDIVWSVANAAIATVGSDGVVTSIGQGRTTVTGTAGAVQAFLTVRVATGAADIEVAPSTLAMDALGDTVTIGGTVVDAAGAALSAVVVTFLGEDTLVATVDSVTGLVTAIGVGVTTVTVIGDTVQKAVPVTVTQTPATVVVTPALATLIPGAQLTFTAAAEDRNANPIASPSITWSSADVAVATITGAGTATAVAAGATVIVATAGAAADTANVTVVVVAVDSVDVSPDSLTLIVGGTDIVSARFFDDQGTEILGPTATWVSTDTDVATVTSAGVVAGVGPGTAWIRGTEDNGADSTYVTVITVSLFDIEVRFVGTLPSASVQTAFSDAELRWEELLIGDLPAAAVTLTAAECVTVAHPAVDETIDDVVIFAEVTAIDGSGGILGQAGPCVVRSTGGLALVGVMQFDEADLSDLETTSDLVETIIHEMGHVLGLGASTPWTTTLVDAGGADPYWPGTEAVTQYDLNGGNSTNKVPVANTGGMGTADAHWRESHMGRELMTGFINIGSVNPLSAITVGAMKDMGYAVDLSKADAYTVSATLRISPDRLFRLRELPVPPPMRVDARGRLVR